MPVTASRFVTWVDVCLARNPEEVETIWLKYDIKSDYILSIISFYRHISKLCTAPIPSARISLHNFLNTTTK